MQGCLTFIGSPVGFGPQLLLFFMVSLDSYKTMMKEWSHNALEWITCHINVLQWITCHHINLLCHKESILHIWDSCHLRTYLDISSSRHQSLPCKWTGSLAGCLWGRNICTGLLQFSIIYDLSNVSVTQQKQILGKIYHTYRKQLQ